MILTTELFKCPHCGVLNRSESTFLTHDNLGNGPYIPFYAITCNRCGREGTLVCKGDTRVCKVRGGRCSWHNCKVVR